MLRKEAFVAINKRQQQISKVLSTYIELSEAYNKSNTLENKDNSGTDDSNEIILKLDKIIEWLCVSFPEGWNTSYCFERFYRLNRARFSIWLKFVFHQNLISPRLKLNEGITQQIS